MKNKKTHTIVFSLFLIFLTQTKAQNNNGIDSVYSYLSSFENDSLRIRFLTKKAFQYNHINLKYAEDFADSAIRLSKNINNKYLLSLSYMNMGLVKKSTGNIESSLSYYDSALILAQKRNDTLALASIYNNIGNVHRLKGNNTLALEYFYSSIKFCGNDSLKIASKLGNVAAVYFDLNEFAKSIEVFTASNKILENTNNSRYLINHYNGITACYIELQDYKKAQLFVNKSLEMSLINNDFHNQSNAYANIGRIQILQKKYSQGINNYQKAITISKQLDNKLNILRIYIYLTDIFYTLNDFQNTIKYGELSEELAKEIFIAKTLKNSYHFLAKAYENSNNYQLAYKYLVLEKIMSDSLLNEQKAKQITELNTKYETEKKDHKIINLTQEQKLHKAENKNKTYLIILLGLIIIVIGLTVYFVRKSEKAKHQKKIFNERAKEAEKQKNRFAKELHDGTGSNLTSIRLQLLSLKTGN